MQFPAGSYSLGITPPGSPDGAFSVCHLQTGATISISGTTCMELGRSASSAEGTAVLNQIISSCKVAPAPTPEPINLDCPAGERVSGGRAITIDNSIQVTLPPGDFVVTIRFEDLAWICNEAAQYDIGLDMRNCRQASIPNPFADLAIIGANKDSCRLLHPETPAPDPRSIQPPSTGDGWLSPDN